MDKRKLSNMLLILTALIWGSAFVAQSIGMEYIGPFTFGAVRSILGGLTLLPVIFFRKKKSQANKEKAEPDEKKEKNEQRKTLLAGGICCGICLTIGSMAQQIGLQYTTAGKGGFITALYILIVPLLGLAFGRKAGKKVWCGVILAVVGMYFLCVKDGFSISKGDWIILAGSFAFAGHILVIDYFSPKVDGVCLSCLQFFICGMICAIPMLVSEQPTVNAVLVSWLTNCICRCIVQWRRIYASDHCTKKYRPDGSIIVDEPGICICCTGGMGHFRRKTFRQRICGMRTGICSSDYCPAPGTESSQFRKSDSFRINCRVAEYAPNA